jgi:hypothetical protein
MIGVLVSYRFRTISPQKHGESELAAVNIQAAV